MSDEALAPDAGVEYPSSDGRPVAETPLHFERLSDARHALTQRFKSRLDVYVGPNMLVYDRQGDPTRSLSPDLFVAFGVEERERDVYKLWEDPSPTFVLELTSKSTRGEDECKKARYSRWGVAEYFLYDPRAEYVKPPLQGFELTGGVYRAMATDVLPNGKAGFASGTLGLGLWLDGLVLRFYDPETGQNLLTPMEVEADLREAEAGLRESLAGRWESLAGRWQAEAVGWESLAGRWQAEAKRCQIEAELAEAKWRESEAKRRQLEAELAVIKARTGIR